MGDEESHDELNKKKNTKDDKKDDNEHPVELSRVGDFWKELHFPGRVILFAVIGIFLVIFGFAVDRLVVYWTRNRDNYFNNLYYKGLTGVLIHSSLGFASFFLGLIYLLVLLAEDKVGKGTSYIFGFLYVIVLLGTGGTVALIKQNFKGIAGLGPTIIAIIWAVLLVVSLLVASVMSCKHKNPNKYRIWMIRNVNLMMFGTYSLPILFYTKKIEALNTSLLVLLLLLQIFVTEVGIHLIFMKKKKVPARKY